MFSVSCQGPAPIIPGQAHTADPSPTEEESEPRDRRWPGRSTQCGWLRQIPGLCSWTGPGHSLGLSFPSENEAEALPSLTQHLVPLGSARDRRTSPSPPSLGFSNLSAGKQEEQDGAAEKEGRKPPQSGEACPKPTLKEEPHNSLPAGFESHLGHFLAV